MNVGLSLLYQSSGDRGIACEECAILNHPEVVTFNRYKSSFRLSHETQEARILVVVKLFWLNSAVKYQL